MKMIWAVIRWDRVDAVVKGLRALKVPGCTISSCRGYGKEWHIYEPIIHGGHRRLEIVVEDSLVDPVIEKIVQSSQTCLAGDGLIGVIDLEKSMEIRNHPST